MALAPSNSSGCYSTTYSDRISDSDSLASSLSFKYVVRTPKIHTKQRLFRDALGTLGRSRRGLVGSVLAY